MQTPARREFKGDRTIARPTPRLYAVVEGKRPLTLRGETLGFGAQGTCFSLATSWLPYMLEKADGTGRLLVQVFFRTSPVVKKALDLWRETFLIRPA